jgi:hypothetical protein
LLWDTLVQAMQNPSAGEPHRPTQLQVRADERWQSLQPHFEEVGKPVRYLVGLDLGQTQDSTALAVLAQEVSASKPC